LTRVEFTRPRGGHVRLDVLVQGQSSSPIFFKGFVDAGATVCGIPRSINARFLGLPVVGRDRNVRIASGMQDFDYVIVPKICIARLRMKLHYESVWAQLRRQFEYASMNFEETDLEERNVKAWITDDGTEQDEEIILGMNFLEKFDMIWKRNGRIIVQR